jgi:hypothetical protein
MTFAEFKKKCSRYQGKETSAYQGHFDDLCRLLGQPPEAVSMHKLLALNLTRAEQEAEASKSKKPITFREQTADELL